MNIDLKYFIYIHSPKGLLGTLLILYLTRLLPPKLPSEFYVALIQQGAESILYKCWPILIG